MRIRGLAFKVYLYSLLTGLVTLAVFVITFHLVRVAQRSAPSPQDQRLVHSLWRARARPAHQHELLRERSFPTDVTLYTITGQLVLSAGLETHPAPTPAQLAALEQAHYLVLENGLTLWPVRERGVLVAVGLVSHGPIAPGAEAMVPRGPPPGLPPRLGEPPLSPHQPRFPRPPPAPGLALPLGILAIVLLGSALLFSRHVVRPLQDLTATAKELGNGALHVRAEVDRKDEIGQLGEQLNDMADRVTRLMSAQQELLANVSHELLTPLARLRVATDLLTDGDAAQGKEIAADMAHDLVELERLLDDVMTVARFDLARLQRGEVLPLRLETLSLEELLDKAVARFRAQAPNRVVNVSLAPELGRVRADPVLLRRVAENLLENARKYSEPESELELRARAQGDSLIVEIEDHGIGIDVTDLERVFTPFFRSDRSRTRATGGVGLGLALAKRVVEAHEGTLSLTSIVGQGTVVRVTLPRASTT